MKNKIFVLTNVFIFSFLVLSCDINLGRFFFRDPTPNDRVGSLEDFGKQEVSDSIIRFLVITDLHFGSDKKRAESELFESVSKLQYQQDFIFLLGDLVEVGDKKYYKQCEAFVAKLSKSFSNAGFSVPKIFSLIGNHDLYQKGFENWKSLNFNQSKGKTFYKFHTNIYSSGKTFTRSWYFLDTASGTLGKDQLDQLQTKLTHDKNPKIVFSHYPMNTEDTSSFMIFKLSDSREVSILIDLFDKTNVDAMISGHYHYGGGYEYGSFFELCLPSFIQNGDDKSSWCYFELDELNGKMKVEQHVILGSKHTVQKRQFSFE